MTDRSDTHPGRRPARLADLFSSAARSAPEAEPVAERDEGEEGEVACPAFGYLRGGRERALGLELRLRAGDREWYPYSHLAACRFDPSVGVLLKFTADVTTLVLIRGSNLDLDVGAVSLIERGLWRQRVVWVREMAVDERRQAGEQIPTIDPHRGRGFRRPGRSQRLSGKDGSRLPAAVGAVGV